MKHALDYSVQYDMLNLLFKLLINMLKTIFLKRIESFTPTTHFSLEESYSFST